MTGPRTTAHWILALALATSGAAAQPPAAEVTATCETLAKLTEAASRQQRPVEVVLYVRTAAAIRARHADPTSCQAKYFASVVAENFEQLSAASSVISVSTIAPMPGWKHRQVEELLQTIDGRAPTVVLADLKAQADIGRMTRTLEKLQVDLDQLKKRQPDRTVPRARTP